MKQGGEQRAGKAPLQSVRSLRGVDPDSLRFASDRDGGRFVTANLRACTDRESALRDLGRLLGLPNWFGANLDALYDALTDLEGPGWVIVLELPKVSKHFDRSSRAALLAVMRDAADYHAAKTGMPFRVFYA
jgi:RNAse (barnase) inhibitor barstar